MSRIARGPDQPCSVARAAGLLADPWVLLLLREAFRGVKRFDDFVSLTGAAKTVASDRLRRLLGAGILERRRYSQRPPRDEYALTDRGRDLFPLYMELMGWGDRHLVNEAGLPVLLRHKRCGALTSPGAACASCGELMKPEDVRYEQGPGAVGPEADRIRERIVLARRRAAGSINNAG